MRTLFFELNGQPREVEIADKLMKSAVSAKRMADPAKAGEVGAPIPGAIGMLHVQAGEQVKKGARLLVMEAMKMQTTVYAPVSGVVKEVLVHLKSAVEARELLLTIEADS
jgi:pyruvate carboxylase